MGSISPPIWGRVSRERAGTGFSPYISWPQRGWPDRYRARDHGHKRRRGFMTDKARIPVILSGARTPIGRFLGGLSTLPATQLGAITIAEAVKRAGIDASAVEDVIMGNVVPAGGGQAPARQASIHAGIPASVPALTIN